MLCSELLDAAMIRTSTFRTRLLPTIRISPSCTTRSNFACILSGRFSISSIKSVPRFASSKRPLRSWVAPVNAPRVWPNNSLSTRFSGMAPQSTATKGCCARELLLWMARAINSLPVPLRPSRRTRTSHCAADSMAFKSSKKAGLFPKSPKD